MGSRPPAPCCRPIAGQDQVCSMTPDSIFTIDFNWLLELSTNQAQFGVHRMQYRKSHLLINICCMQSNTCKISRASIDASWSGSERMGLLVRPSCMRVLLQKIMFISLTKQWSLWSFCLSPCCLSAQAIQLSAYLSPSPISILKIQIMYIYRFR